MAHKTFISYKYYDSRHIRDLIINAMPYGTANYYQGEYGFNPLSLDDGQLRKCIANMLFDTSVTILILSPNVAASEWVNFELWYSLKKITRGNIQSQPNGIIVVYTENLLGFDLLSNRFVFNIPLPTIIRQNLSKNYFVVVELNEFLKNINKYIEIAYDRAQNVDQYNLRIE